MSRERTRLLELLREHSYREGDFVLASGKRSPYYVDVRRTALLPEGAELIGEAMLSAIRERGWDPRAVGGLAIGADPLATATSLASWRARDAGPPFSAMLIRKAAKGHGTGRRVELAGDVAAGASVVILEDTVTSGGSTLSAVEAAREEGLRVLGAVCVVDRDEGGQARLEGAGVVFDSLFTVADLGGGGA